MPNVNITDLPGGTFAAGHKFEMFNTLAGQNQSVTIPAQSVQTQNCVDIALAGNTAGALATINSGTAVLAGGNNITLSQNGNSITISAFNQSLQTQMTGLTAGMSNLGNTAGTTGLVSNQLVLVGGSNISLSQSVNGNSATITINGASGGGGSNPTVSFFHNIEYATIASNLLSIGPAFGKVGLFPIRPDNGPFPGDMTINTLYMLWTQSGSTATMSRTFTSSFFVGIYTFDGASLNLLNSASTALAFGAAATNNSTGFAGLRWLTFGTGAWSTTPVLNFGSHYWIATLVQSSGVTNNTVAFYGQAIWPFSAPGFQGSIGAAAVTDTTQGFAPLYGQYSAASTTAFPAAINTTQLLRQINAAIDVPLFELNMGLPGSF